MNEDTMVTEVLRPRRTGRGWWVVGSVFAVVVLGASALSAAAWLARHTEVQDQTYQVATQQIQIDIDNGDVTLRPGGEGVAVHRRLTWSWSKPTISETWDGQTLHIKADCPSVNFGPGCGVDYTIGVPAGVSVTGHSSVGDLTVAGLRGDLTLSTSVGDVSVTDASGALSLRSSTGDVTASGLASTSVEAHTSTGDVTLRFVSPPASVHATTSTGDISVAVPAGDAYRVQASASTGDVTTTVAQDPASTRTIDAHTSTGDVSIEPAR